MSERVTRLLLALSAGAFFACATPAPPATDPSLSFAAVTAQSNYDPFQGFNRSMFWVNNDLLDRFIYAPLAHGWIYVSPLTVRTHMEQFFDNLNFPGYFVQPLLQGDPRQSAIALSRFAVNSSIGIAGIFDPANHFFGLPRRAEDFGQTLGVWGVPQGPYLVLPLIAPRSTVRDFAATPVDWILNVGDGYFWPWFAPYGETMIRDVNRRALVDEDLKAGREAAVDWYSSARDLYLQSRARDVRNGAEEAAEAPGDDFYEINDDE